MTTKASTNGRRLFRLYLAMLLVLAPMWAPLGVAAAGLSAATAGPMPCCPTASTETSHPAQTAASSPQSATCGHCGGDEPGGQCHCCVFATAAAIPVLEVSTHLPLGLEFIKQTAPVALPSTPYQAPYRPPIRFL